MKEIKFYLALTLLLACQQLSHSLPQGSTKDTDAGAPQSECVCVSPLACLVQVEVNTNSECLADEVCCPDGQISDEGIIDFLLEEDECTCATEDECLTDLSGSISSAANTCTGNNVCCNVSTDSIIDQFTGIDLTDLFQNETNCKCVVAEQCLDANAPVLDCHERAVCCNEEDIREAAPGPITAVEPSSLPETCTCTEQADCTSATGLSSLVHVRSTSPHTCVGTQVCCPLAEPSVVQEQAGCTCVAEKYCSAGAGQLIDPIPFGFECTNNDVCCTNARVQVPESGSCTCTHNSFCEDDPSLPSHPHSEYQRCNDPKICCSKPKIFESPPKCGLSFEANFRINVRISLGFEAKFSEFPWMVALTELKNDGNEAYLCGGSLIHPSVVLTSADCVDKREGSILKVRAGDWDLESLTEERPFIDRQVNEIKIHPSWSADTLNNNVALLYLSSEIPLQGHINTICLPNETTLFDTACSLSGWGKSKFSGRSSYHTTLKKVNLPFLTTEECQQQLRQTKLGNEFVLDPSNVCAGGTREDACTGDGGSPLTCTMEDGSNREVQVGIVSWGLKCGRRGTPGVYSSTVQASKWIRDTVTQDFGQEAASFFT